MNHLNDCFHHWHCALGTCKDFMLPHSMGIPLHDFNRLYSCISNNVPNRDLEHSSPAIGHGQVSMPHKHLWGKFNIPFLFDHCIDNQLRSVSFDLQWLKLWVLFTRHTSMAYNKWEWKIDLWLIKSTWCSLPIPWQPSTIVCKPGNLVTVGSHQRLV